MNILIKSALITDNFSPFNGEVKDILIENDIIAQIGENLSKETDKVIDAKGMNISPGWFDLRCNFREPGFEYKEDINSGCKAAVAGGFTGVALMPSTLPPVDNKAQVEFVRNKTTGKIIDVHSIGTLSSKLEGKDISEMYDMHLAGAVAFSDDKKPIDNSGLLLRALLYAKNFGGLVMNFPDDKSISGKGVMNEGVESTMLGMKGMPAIAEEIMILRDLQLAEYADASIHFSNVSTAGAVQIIKDAKSKGLKVSADVNAHNLSLDDSLLADFDSHFKVKPPLRSASDIIALKEGLADGVLDVICSDHSPEDIENKKLEFEHAAYGIIGLESAFGVLNKSLEKSMNIADIISKITTNPRKILSLPSVSINKGNKANLTIFNPNIEWTFDEKHIRSKSKNTPFIGKQLKGKAIAVINNSQLQYCED